MINRDHQNSKAKSSGTPTDGNVLPNEQVKFWARVFLGISLSIFLHVITSIATWKLASHYDIDRLSRQPIILEWIEPSSTKPSDWQSPETQIVRKTELPSDALLPDSKEARRRFLSADRQTVKEESQAARSGLTENRSNSETTQTQNTPKTARQKPQSRPPNHQMTESDPRRREPEEVLQSALDGIPVKKFLSEKDTFEKTQRDELLLPSDPRRIPGVSTSGELLPSDIRLGDFTALNTDRFTYYTFYARVEEQIRHRWVRYVKAALYGGGDVPMGKSEFLTNLEIVLNRRGEFIRAIIHQLGIERSRFSSGLSRGAMIPNPPREMLKPDGTIRLLYTFHVDQVPQLAKRSRTEEDLE